MIKFLPVLLTCFTVNAAEPFFQEQSIFRYQEKHVHGSSIIECPNGDLLACWFYGSGERTADDVLIRGSRLRKNAKSWEPVFDLADTPGFPDCNPVLFIDGRQRLWLVWVLVLAHQWESSLLKYRISSDYQNSAAPVWQWQDVLTLKPGEEFVHRVNLGFKELNYEEPFWAGYAPPYTKMIKDASQDPFKRQIGWMTRIHPLHLSGGRILLPLYSDGFNFSLIAISDDNGANWQPSSPIVGLGPIQPTLVQRANGEIVAYLRDSGPAPNRVLTSTSKDQGVTWSTAMDTNIPNPGSSLEVIALKNGHWLMVHNDTEEGRHSLAVQISDDEGQTWKWRRGLALALPGEKSFAYPSLLQSGSGLVQITFSYSEGNKKTIKHVTINEEWVRQGAE